MMRTITVAVAITVAFGGAVLVGAQAGSIDPPWQAFIAAAGADQKQSIEGVPVVGALVDSDLRLPFTPW